ncbi:unnamed protein product [Plutella xylostella]|uniref:(diamondback moth) hypothetical protein n=1 Tax=Plutella xylostella TaxID=51655 RepID=A0A8S4G9R4_PLUXY|nr:unnamed protein product [Plutella xylostella]
MQMEVQKMAAQGVIERASQGPGFESHLFLVKKSDGSHRPVLNLKALNNFLVSGKFRLVNMYKVPYFFQPNDWMMKIDLSQAYFHVPVAESHRRFLRFVAPCGHPSRCPEDPPQHCVWQMTSLPFGLASAPRTFATLSNWVAQQLRLRGMRVLVYLDDYLLVNQSRRRLRDHAHQAKALLHELGWVINKGKSSAQPVQNIEFLGIEWSTVQNIKSLPREKLFKLQGCLEKFLVAPAWSPLDLQKLVGWLNFASFIVPYGRINFRSLLTLMQRAVREGISVAPTAQAVVDLQWWMNHFKEVSEIWLQPPTHFIVTDASDVGWGAYVDGHYLQGPWLAQETSFRANRKELLAISFVLQNMAQVFADKTILVQSDNQTALAYLRNQGGTRSEPLLSIARNIYTHLMTHRIHLMTSYIPGPLNSVADSLSRFKALPEWHLLPIATRLIFRKWGIPIIDLFASQNAHVVPRYVTRDLRDPAADFHDAFSRTWTYKLAWIFPLSCLMHQVLYAMNQAQGKYIVICPRWLNVFWRADLKARALCPPFTIHNLHRVLKDTTTGQPPPQLVIDWLVHNDPISDNLFDISRRCAILLLLASGRRVHDLTLLSVAPDHMEDHDGRITFWPKYGSKTDCLARRQSGWELSSGPHANIDLVRWLRRLVELSAPRRAQAETSSLFVTTCGAPRAASRTVIGGWVRTVLSEAGIHDAPGSTRSAVASLSWVQNFPVEDILARGNWTSQNTLLRYYERPLARSTSDTASAMTNCFKPV